jgi:acetate kinase
MADTAILTVNAGSSSLKIGLFTQDEATLTQIVHGEVEGLGGYHAHFTARDPQGHPIADFGWPATPAHDQVFAQILAWAQDHLDGRRLIAVGHRVVHGGRTFAGPALITPEVVHAMQALVPLAPLHQPSCLAAIRAVSTSLPALPQVACFDTAFHRTMPEVARRFAIPRALHDEGIERYGFHGLSYSYIATRLKTLAPAATRVVIAHLGAGASLCALQAGKSIDTTMGLTALDGLPMGTRCGAIDPGVLLYLLQEKRLTPAALEDLLYHQSGLLGVSGQSADMRELEASQTPSAREAIDLFAYQIARQTALMAHALSGLDALIFTAGIGEHASTLRAAVCTRLAWLGVSLDPAIAPRGETLISPPASPVAVWVIPTDEEAVIARETAALVK